MPENVKKKDLLIAGGGLAGLGLAYQLKKRDPGLDIAVLEKRRFPLPQAIAKVGESTVEIGSHYIEHELDTGEHLKQKHLRKFGLRCFFGSPQGDFSQQDELGPSREFGLPAYQLDRGDLENHLKDKVCALGVEVLDDTSVEGIRLSNDGHRTEALVAGEALTLQSRWLVDASGRRALIKDHLQLAKKNEHKASAVWFRVARRIEIDDWSQNSDWQRRCDIQGRRWLSTNHLMGPGYWVWIIPLAADITSIGIVMDEQAFAEAGIDSADTALAWLGRHQARCAEAIAGARMMDFVCLRDYSYGCKQLFSDDRWGISGEAGLFADPFYSPGTDFIAYANNFLCDLILSDRRGEDTRIKNAVYQRLLYSFYERTMSLYQGQYGGFGDRRMMSLKLVWDYSYYWGVLALLFFQNSMTDISLLSSVSVELLRIQQVNDRLQARLRERAARRLVLPCQGLFINQIAVPCITTLHNTLMRARELDPRRQVLENIALLERIAPCIEDMLRDDAGPHISDEERELLGEYRRWMLA